MWLSPPLTIIIAVSKLSKIACKFSWLAANARAWHFSYDETARRWLDDKGRGDLFSTIASIVKEGAGVDVPFA